MPITKNMRVQTNLVVNKKKLQGVVISVDKKHNYDGKIKPYMVYLDEPYFFRGKEDYYKYFAEDELQETNS